MNIDKSILKCHKVRTIRPYFTFCGLTMEREELAEHLLDTFIESLSKLYSSEIEEFGSFFHYDEHYSSKYNKKSRFNEPFRTSRKVENENSTFIMKRITPSFRYWSCEGDHFLSSGFSLEQFENFRPGSKLSEQDLQIQNLFSTINEQISTHLVALKQPKVEEVRVVTHYYAEGTFVHNTIEFHVIVSHEGERNVVTVNIELTEKDVFENHPESHLYNIAIMHNFISNKPFVVKTIAEEWKREVVQEKCLGQWIYLFGEATQSSGVSNTKITVQKTVRLDLKDNTTLKDLVKYLFEMKNVHKNISI